MPWCPNPNCPHRRRTGRPAEYRAAVDTCGDCGTSLVDTLEEAGVEPEADRGRRVPKLGSLPAPLRRRLLVTAAVVVCLWLLALVPMPLIDWQTLAERAGFWVFEPGTFSIVGRGILPVLAGFVLVETIALLNGRWRRNRHGDPELRRWLNGWSIGLGLVLAAAGGYATALGLETMWATWGVSPFRLEPGLTFRLAMTGLSLMGTTAFLVGALVIGRRGLGNGFAVVLLAQQALFLPGWIEQWGRLATVFGIGFDLLIAAGLTIAMVAIALWLLTYADRRPFGAPIRLPTCGNFPLELAAMLLVAATTVSPWLDLNAFEWVVETFYAGRLELGLLFLGSLVVLLVPVSTAFYWRHRERLSGRVEWRQARVTTFLGLAGLLGISIYADQHTATDLIVPLPLSVLIVTAVAADLVAEFRMRRAAPGGVDLVARSAHHDVGDAVEALRAEEPGLAVAQGLYFRSLGYVFVPYVPVVVLVPKGSEPADVGSGRTEPDST